MLDDLQPIEASIPSAYLFPIVLILLSYRVMLSLNQWVATFEQLGTHELCVTHGQRHAGNLHVSPLQSPKQALWESHQKTIWVSRIQ